MTLRILLVSLFGLLSHAAAQENGARRALLIGIGQYKSDRLGALYGATNDIDVLSRVLAQHYGFKRENMVFLRDEKATRAAILRELERLVKVTGKNDVVYVHFSGHGSFRNDEDGDEGDDDDHDETLLPYDGRTKGVPDIVDDELGNIFGRLRTDNAVLVFDCCHSGTVTRSPTLVARMVPPDDRDELYKRKLVARSVLPVLAQRFVVFSGAQPHESALDGLCGRRFHGLFSYSLARSLVAAARADEVPSPMSILKGAEAELERLKVTFGRPFLPEPHLEVENEKRLKQPLFPPVPGGATGTPWLEVRHMADAPTVRLDGADVSSAPVGSVWGIYGADTTKFIFGRATARATVTGHAKGHAVATLDPADAKIPKQARAVALMTARGESRVAIRFGAAPEADRKALAAELERESIVRFARKGEFARFVIAREPDGWAVFGAAGTEKIVSIRATDASRAARQLARVLARWQTAHELVSIENEAARMRLELRLVGEPAPAVRKGLQSRSVGVTASSADVARRFHQAGQERTPQNHLVLELRASRDCYLTIVDVDGEGNVNVLFPNNYQNRDFLPDGLIRGGQHARIPDSLATGNRAGFVWDLRPPGGLDTIRAFATTDLDTARAIRKHVARLAAGEKPGEGLAALRAELLKRSVGVSKSDGTQESTDRDWTAATVTFRTGK